MQKHFFLISAFIICFPSHATHWFLDSKCSKSYFRDSYGRGIKSAFAQKENIRANLYDEECYQLGRYQGQAIVANAPEQRDCFQSFLNGHSAGIQNFYNNNVANTCYSTGHIAGLADLNIAAREGDLEVAGEKCIRAYQEGRRSYKNGLTNDPTSIDGEKSRYCYGLGWFEAPLFYINF